MSPLFNCWVGARKPHELRDEDAAHQAGGQASPPAATRGALAQNGRRGCCTRATDAGRGRNGLAMLFALLRQDANAQRSDR